MLCPCDSILNNSSKLIIIDSDWDVEVLCYAPVIAFLVVTHLGTGGKVSLRKLTTSNWCLNKLVFEQQQ